MEMMVSVVILGLIATTSFVSLRASRQKDELNTAVRLVAGDLRALQARALAAQNILTCMDSGTSLKIVCERSTVSCFPSSCNPLPPFGVGFHAVKGATAYDLFADVDAGKNDWLETDASEIFLVRDIAKSGAQNVVINDLITSVSLSSVEVSFQRQNGSMGISGCYAPCSAPVALRIQLRHTQSGDVKEVALNSYTGRISIQ